MSKIAFSDIVFAPSGTSLDDCISHFRDFIQGSSIPYAFHENDESFIGLRAYYASGLRHVLSSDLYIPGPLSDELSIITSANTFAGALFYERFVAPVQIDAYDRALVINNCHDNFYHDGPFEGKVGGIIGALHGLRQKVMTPEMERYKGHLMVQGNPERIEFTDDQKRKIAEAAVILAKSGTIKSGASSDSFTWRTSYAHELLSHYGYHYRLFFPWEVCSIIIQGLKK